MVAGIFIIGTYFLGGPQRYTLVYKDLAYEPKT